MDAVWCFVFGQQQLVAQCPIRPHCLPHAKCEGAQLLYNINMVGLFCRGGRSKHSGCTKEWLQAETVVTFKREQMQTNSVYRRLLVQCTREISAINL